MISEEIQEQYADELEAFHIWMKDAGYTGHTVKSYTGDVAEFLSSIQGKSLEQVKKLHVLSYLSRARERGVSDATRNRKHAAVNCFFKSLIELEVLTNNPASGIKNPKPRKSSARLSG